MTENAIQKTTGQTLPVKTATEMQELGALFERSGMFGCKQQGQGTVLVMSCLMSGMNPLEFIEHYHLVDGRPSMRADAMLSKLVERGGDYQIVQRDAEGAKISVQAGKRKGEFAFSWEDAKKEPFPYQKDGKTLKTNWATPRARTQMLWARVVSDAVRTVDPGAVRGTYTPEEIQDFTTHDPDPVEYEPPRGMTSASEPEAVEAEVVEPEQEVDPNIVPAGPNQGKNWDVFAEKQLNQFLQLKSKKLTDAHRKAIRAVLESRNNEKGTSDHE